MTSTLTKTAAKSKLTDLERCYTATRALHEIQVLAYELQDLGVAHPKLQEIIDLAHKTVLVTNHLDGRIGRRD